MSKLAYALVIALFVVSIAAGIFVATTKLGPSRVTTTVANVVEKARPSNNTTTIINKAVVTTYAAATTSYLAVTALPLTKVWDAGQHISINTIVVNADYGNDTFQWYNGSFSNPIPSATKSTYNTIAGAPGSFDYFVVMTDSKNETVQSNGAFYVVYADPAVKIVPMMNLSTKPNDSIWINSTILNKGDGQDTYQWYNDTENVSILIPHATSLNYHAVAGERNGTLKYFVIVTDSNGGRGKSNIANITIRN